MCFSIKVKKELNKVKGGMNSRIGKLSSVSERNCASKEYRV